MIDSESGDCWRSSRAQCFFVFLHHHHHHQGGESCITAYCVRYLHIQPSLCLLGVSLMTPSPSSRLTNGNINITACAPP